MNLILSVNPWWIGLSAGALWNDFDGRALKDFEPSSAFDERLASYTICLKIKYFNKFSGWFLMSSSPWHPRWDVVGKDASYYYG